MFAIPVMDLLGSQVVRAVAGNRADYQPVRSSLVNSAAPVVVAKALLGLARFPAIYVADLDAITRAGSDRHFELLKNLGALLAEQNVSELWLDAGAAPWIADLAASLDGIRLVPVLGSENLEDTESLAARRSSLAGLDCVLSLDYRAGELIGPRGIDEMPRDWPRRVIVMELAAVGTGRGPVLDRLTRIAGVAHAAGRVDVGFFAAGGVRDVNDLRTIAARGAAGVLLASALHDGRIDPAALGTFIEPAQKCADY